MSTSSDFNQALIELTRQALFAYDTATHRFTYLSPACAALFKLQADSLMSPAALLALVHPEDRHFVTEKLAALLEGEVVHSLEFRILHPGQEERWVCLTPALLEQAPGRRLVAGHVEDITAQRHHNDNLERFSNKKNAILNILSHDLTTPLANIQSLSGLLTQRLTPSQDEEPQELVSLIEQSSRQGIELIQEFINEEFLESSQVELVKRRVNLVGKLRETLEEYIHEGELAGERLTFLTGSEELYAEVDDNKLMQAVNNLISNALKFTPDGGVVTVSLEEEAESVLVKVADTGIGIPQKYHAILFDRFTRARRPGLKGQPSHGLGMSIIKNIVEWHGGRIWFESQQGKGTTFFIRLPKE